MAARSPRARASSSSRAPMLMSPFNSPATENDPTHHHARFHQGVALCGLREWENLADERLDRLGREQMERRSHVVVGRITGAGDANAAGDDQPGIDLYPLGADIAEHDHDRLLCAR